MSTGIMMEIGSGPGAQPRTQEHRSKLENSDDDDSEEEIPHISPSKSKIDPTTRSLDYRRTRGRQLDDESPQSRHNKRRRIGSAGENGSSSPENDRVRAGLLNSINAILRKEAQSSQHEVSQVNGGIQDPGTGPAQSSRLDNTKRTEHPRSTSQSDRATSLPSTHPETEIESQKGTSEDFEDAKTFESVGGYSQSEENLTGNEQPDEGSFAQDVAEFESRYPEGFVGDESYLGAVEDDNITVHIDPSCLRTALQLMRHHAWGGFRMGWHQRSFDIESSDTRPIRILLELLEKFERLLAAAPKAPRHAEQNRFLKRYCNLVSYYFSEIGSTLKTIREIYQKQESVNTKLHSDIISCAIPMLFHVLVSAWELGGRDWRRTMFTISTIDLLGRTINWIGQLYRPLLRRLVRQSPDSLRDESKAQRTQREKQEELEKYRKDLCRLITESVDALEEEENRRNLERQIQQENLIRQEELIAQQKQEEEAVMMSIRERQRRSLMSIRSIHTPLSESSRPSSRQMSAAREVPSPKPSRARPAQIQPPRSNGGDWSREEKVYLFKKLQDSYPDLMDLDDVRWELNRTLEETEDMAEELLGLMLETVHPEQAAADRDAHIHEVMQAYRRTWGHER
ncbi:hypothetical protein ABKA04_005349 [Annulohypoxylon sp. FPYF3050]